MSSFQEANIDGTQFQGTDLSMLDHYSLESCYFNTPTNYDQTTRFPEGFDPASQRWKRGMSKDSTAQSP